MKKILIIQGGGRPKGNMRQLVGAFVQVAMEAGNEVKTISLNKIQVKGRLGCNACRYGKPCIQKDGFNGLSPKNQGSRLHCICVAAAVLDDLGHAESICGAVLLHCGGRSEPTVGAV